jgi:uncharacterized protein YdaT
MDKITLPVAAGGKEIDVDMTAFAPHIQAALMLRGLRQKVADSCASAKAKGWTEAQAKEACDKVIAGLMAGTWAKRATGPRATSEEAFVIGRIVAKIKAHAKAKNARLPAEDALRAHAEKVMAAPAHAAWIEALRAEYRAKKASAPSIDLDDLL